MAKKAIITWADSVSAGVTHTKVYKDDVEIGQVPIGVGRFEDGDVQDGETYKYEVQSLGPKGETTEEIEGTNMLYRTIAAGVKPKLTNFRVESGQPSRIYFDTPYGEPVGLATTGFAVGGNTITGLDTSAKYFSVGTPFTFWDQAITIKLESGDGTINDFTMEEVINQIPTPSTTSVLYVNTSSQGAGDGSSEANATTLSAVGSPANDTTVWIKAGNYGAQRLLISKIAGVDDPIIYKGYTSVIGDLDNDMMVDSFDDTSQVSANSIYDDTKYPLLDGNYTTFSSISASSSRYISVQNMQVDRCGLTNNSGAYSVYMDNGVRFMHIKNVLAANARTNINVNIGEGFHLQQSGTAEKVTLEKCIAFDNNAGNFRIQAENGFCKLKSNISRTYYLGGAGSHQPIDYHISLYGTDDNVISDNNLKRMVDDDHGGHGIGTKEGGSRNLIVGNTLWDIGEGIYMGHSPTEYNVVKRNSFKQSGDKGGITALMVRDGADNNIIEQNYMDSAYQVMVIWDSGEWEVDPVGPSNNVFRNNLSVNGTKLITFSKDASAGADKAMDGNKVYNNTFVNINKASSAIIQNINQPAAEITNTSVYNNIFQNYNTLYDLAGVGIGTTVDFQYNNWYDNSFGTPSGTGNFSINPQFDSNYQPQATFGDVDVPTISGITNDYNGDERDTTNTTVGSVKHNDEVASDTPEPSSYLLDQHLNSIFGISVFKLKSTATNFAKIRRDNDNATTDVLLEDSGAISLSSTVSAGGDLATWVGANSAYIETAYDQSGSGNDVTQTTTTKQPRLVNAGVLDVYNAIAQIQFMSSVKTLELAGGLTELNHGSNFTAVILVNANSGGNSGNYLCTSNTDANRMTLKIDHTPQENFAQFQVAGAANVLEVPVSEKAELRQLQVVTSDTTPTYNGWVNGVASPSNPLTDQFAGTYTNDILRLGAQHNDLTQVDGGIQELIFFSEEKSGTDIGLIEADLTTRYSL